MVRQYRGPEPVACSIEVCRGQVQEPQDQDRILGALREGLGFDLEHGKQIERCAVLGDAAWERWLVGTLRLFFRNSEVRLFPPTDRAAALDWLRAG